MEQREAAFSTLVTGGAVYCWLAPVFVAVFGRNQVFAAVLGVAGIAALALAATQLPGIGDIEGLYRQDRWLAIAAGLVTVSPVLLLGYAVTGSMWPLIATIVAGTAALVLQHVVRGDIGWIDD